MTEYKATPEQWQDGKHCADAGAIAFACILELRARVEALEVNTKQWRTDHLRLANTCASLAPDRLKFFNALLPDDDNSQPTSNPSQIRSSLVQQLREQAPRYRNGGVGREVWLINRAYSAGADEELEACCEWVSNELSPDIVDMVRAARRPKPPTLKEQALSDLKNAYNADTIDDTTFENIRRALNQLPDN